MIQKVKKKKKAKVKDTESKVQDSITKYLKSFDLKSRYIYKEGEW